MPQDVLAQVLRRLADLERRVALSIRVGRVAEVQDRPYRVIVDLGAIGGEPVLTPPLHVLVPRSGSSMIDFSPLDRGEGVLVLAPGGSSSVMFAVPSLARGSIELVAPPGGARYMSGTLVTSGDVRAGASVVLGSVLDAGVSLRTHIHPGTFLKAPVGKPPAYPGFNVRGTTGAPAA